MPLEQSDEEHLQKAFNLYYKELVRHANKYLFDIGESENMVQDVFVQLWENRDCVHIHTSSRSYLYIMVRNKCLNHLKSIKIVDNVKAIELFCEREDSELERNDLNPFVKYEEVEKLISLMPQNMREIFEMKHLSNYTYLEIAQELNISPNTVKTQLKRAKARLLHVANSVAIIFYLYFS